MLPTTTTTDPQFDDKFDKIQRWYRSKDENAKLPKSLQEQFDRWNTIYELINKKEYRYERESKIIKMLRAHFPDLSERTIRHSLADTRKFFADIDVPHQPFERVMLIAAAKEALKRAQDNNDSKAENAAIKNLITLTGADKPEEIVENKTVINILNYNPAQLGGELMPEDELQRIIKGFQADDEQRRKQPFSSFEIIPNTDEEGGNA